MLPSGETHKQQSDCFSGYHVCQVDSHWQAYLFYWSRLQWDRFLRNLGAIMALPYPLYPVDLTYSKETLNNYHLSAVEGNPLVGSTSVRGSTSGDSFELTVLSLAN